MKKLVYMLCVLLLISGCSKSQGSFKEGNIQFTSIFYKINDTIEKGKWEMGFLNEEAVSSSEIEKLYQLDMNKIEQCELRQSLIAGQMSEIGFFKVDKKDEAMLSTGIQYRLTALKQQWGTYISNANSVVDSAYQGRIGQYYYIIIGEDSKKVVNYIMKMK